MTAPNIDDHSTPDGHCILDPELSEARKPEGWPKAKLPAKGGVLAWTLTSFDMRRYEERNEPQTSEKARDEQCLYTRTR